MNSPSTENAHGPKLCKDCAHYSPGVFSLTAGGIGRPEQCTSPKNASVVNGLPRLSPEQARYNFVSGACQEAGYWWEPK